MIRIGAYELGERVARGGMGEVWSGRHSAGGEVAFKVITGDAAKNPAYVSMFRREVQATARLQHRNIIAVLDYGVLPAAAAEVGLSPGSPYYVMEWIEGRTLSKDGEWEWDQVRDVLVATLRGLAHAHARDVIHRDIKPSNILIEETDRGHHRVVLTDFGVAHALDHNAPTFEWDDPGALREQASGTPQAMAPEQLLGHFRDYGPWTDLYAIGITAYYLVCGRLPFRGTTEEVCLQQLQAPLPELRPRFDVPERFGDWLAALTDKQFTHRTANAAFAERDLLALGEPRTTAVMTAVTGMDDDSGGYLDEQDTEIDTPPIPRSTGGLSTATTDVPWLPSAWVPRGVGLLGMKTIPFMGREDERERLWQELTAVIERGRPAAVVVRGAAGTGKSRLVQWLCRRARELGIANVMRAFHQPSPSEVVGLGGMLAEHYRCVGLSPQLVQARLTGMLTVELAEIRALTEIMRQERKGADSSLAADMLLSSRERIAIAARAVGRSAEHPLILSLDDVQWGPEAIGLARHIVEDDACGPCLVAVTVRDDALNEHVARALDAFCDGPHVTTLQLDALNEETTRRFVRQGLGLKGETARLVARRCGGSPLFATQLVTHWLETGQLELDGDELALSVSDPSMPGAIESLWGQRTDAIEQRFDDVDAVRRRVEVAATLGQVFDEAEWKDVCAAAGLAAVPGLTDAMVDASLWVRRDQTLSFTHGLLRDSIRDAAIKRKTWKKANMAVARTLMQRYAADHPGLAARVSRHFVEAGAYDVANMSLAEAIQRAERAVDQRTLGELYEVLGTVLEKLNVPDRDPRWLDVRVAAGWSAYRGSHQEDLERALQIAHDAIELARDVGSADQLANALRLAAEVRSTQGRFDLGVQLAMEAYDLLRPTNRRWVEVALSFVRMDLCGVDIPRGRALAELILEKAEHPAHLVWAHVNAANGAMQMEEFEPALQQLEAAREIAQEHGIVKWFGRIESGLGDRAYWLEDFAEAEAAYTRAWHANEAFAANRAMVDTARERAARCMLLNGRPAEALPHLVEIYEAMKLGQFGDYCHPASAILGCAAVMGNYELFDEVFDDAFVFVHNPDEFQSHVYLLVFEALKAAGEQTRLDRTVVRAREVMDQAYFPELHRGSD